MKAAALVWLLLLSSLPVTAAEVVIEADRLAPPELTADFGETVTFVNRSARLVHIEFAPRPEGHHVFQAGRRERQRVADTRPRAAGLPRPHPGGHLR